MRDVYRLGFLLMVICAVAGAALAVTYAQTRPLIEQQQVWALEESLKALLPDAERFEQQGEEEEAEKVFYIGYRGDEKVGVVALFSQGGYGGTIRMMVGVDMDGKITGIRIMEHAETPGLGARITEPWFGEQFVGKSVSDPLTIGEDLEAITGATISSRSVAGGVKLIAGEIERTFLAADAHAIDLAQVPDGVYQGEAQGFGGKTRVEVEVKGGRLVRVDIVENYDTPEIAGQALKAIPERMIEEQNINVDTYSGATFTSQGIIDAVTDALKEFATPAAGQQINIGDIPDGTYTGTAQGFGGPIEVEVTVAGGKITAVKVLSHNDSPGVSDTAIQKVPERIVAEQRLEVDVVSGATFTSCGIMDAVQNALMGAK